MKPLKAIRRLAGAGLSALALTAQAASVPPGGYVLGNYTLYGLADSVTSFSGTGMYDGAGYNSPLANPVPVTDDRADTFYATLPYPGYSDVTLGLGFTTTRVVNGPGDDLAFLFTWDQTGNAMDVTVNGITQPLTLQTLRGCGTPTTQCVLDGMHWGFLPTGLPRIYDNNLLLVGLADLSDFGVAPGADLPGDVRLHLHQGGSGTNVVVFNLAGAMHVAPVPVPAAFWLMASGLGLLGAGAWRRRS
ncbi:MAG: hypothetical protein D6721_03455 [Gammaproteobacteria bacterium]|nr:MAG: hypothetical protein D6721_03455 [Gammaproteobacteria bacterium]